MKIILLPLVLLFASQAFAMSFELTIVFPDKEKKTFVVDKGVQQVPLKAKKWKCKISKDLPKPDGAVSKVLSCDGPSNTTVSISLICRENTPAFNSISLTEGSKFYDVDLSCNM